MADVDEIYSAYSFALVRTTFHVKFYEQKMDEKQRHRLAGLTTEMQKAHDSAIGARDSAHIWGAILDSLGRALDREVKTDEDIDQIKAKYSAQT